MYGSFIVTMNNYMLVSPTRGPSIHCKNLSKNFLVVNVKLCQFRSIESKIVIEPIPLTVSPSRYRTRICLNVSCENLTEKGARATEKAKEGLGIAPSALIMVGLTSVITYLPSAISPRIVHSVSYGFGLCISGRFIITLLSR